MSKKFVSVMSIILAVIMVATLVLAVLPAAAGAVSQSQIDALQTQKEAIADKKKAASQQVNALKTQQAGILEQKAALDEQNELARQNIELLEQQIELYDEMIAQKAEELAVAENLRDEQLERYRTRVRAMEENGKYNYVTVLLSATSLSDLISKMDDIGEIMQSDKDLENQYKASVVECKNLKQEYEDTQAEMVTRQDELKEEKAALEIQIGEATAMIADLQSDIDEYTKAYNENAAAEKDLINEMNRLSAELAAQAEKDKNNGTSSGVAGSGKFSWPVPSCTYITSGYGNRVHPIFHTTKWHAGLDIGASSGATIQAADAGTVAVATYSSSYGNYVMINHANGYTTLYAHMSSIAVSAGDSVTQGQAIGYVGSTGWSTGPHCHFEIRYNGSTVDPSGYFSGLTYAADA